MSTVRFAALGRSGAATPFMSQWIEAIHPKQTGQRHHFVPAFYLKGWSGEDGQICQFHRPEGCPRVCADRRHPNATGLERGLYTIKGVPSHEANVLEERFLKNVDQDAAEARALFLNGQDNDIPPRLRTGWCRFVMSMLHRHPSRVRRIRRQANEAFHSSLLAGEAEYLAGKQPNDPATLVDYAQSRDPALFEKAGPITLQHLCDLPSMGGEIIRMRWHIVTIPAGRHRLLTSDRPVLMALPLNAPHAHIVLPLTPDKVFVATHTDQALDAILSIVAQGKFAAQLNEIVVSQALTYVFGENDSQLRFVEKRLPPRPPEDVTWHPAGTF